MRMDGGLVLVVLVTGLSAIRDQKCEYRGDVRSGACCEPVDGEPTMRWYTLVLRRRSGSDGSGLGMESMGIPDR